MNARTRQAGIERLIEELEIIDPTETSVGTLNRSGERLGVAIIHETGHVYAIPKGSGAEHDPELLFRIPVETMGVEAAIKAVERNLEPDGGPQMRECDMLGCRNPVPNDQGKSVAPGTYLAVCDACAPVVATVR